MHTLARVLTLSFIFSGPAHAAARFSGGMCASQGSWLDNALKQSRLIVDALETLKNDPNCRTLTQALENAPKLQAVQPGDTESFASTFRELSALNDFLNPSHFDNLNAAMSRHGKDPQKFHDAVFNVVFSKSYESLKDLSNSAAFSGLPEGQRARARNVSARLRGFLADSKKIANLSMATGRAILGALPQSSLCLHNKSSTAASLFGAVTHIAASLVSGGEVGGVGEFTSSLLNYSREMKYMKSLKPLEYEAFKNSVSCLVESTAEAYCSIQDAEDALEALKRSGPGGRGSFREVLAASSQDPVASPLAGLVIYMRDIPVVQNWLQKVLFGISPRTSWQGSGKNENWASYLGFIQSVNSLQANFRDKEQQYHTNTSGRDHLTKVGQLKEIFNETVEVLKNRSGRNSVNFFLRTMQEERLPFFLLGVEMPADYDSEVNNADTYWLRWVREGANGFDNPDRLLQTIKDNLWRIIERAQVEANALFANRMVVDPHNLVTEAMRGPGISPYQAFIHQRSYYTNLIRKLDGSVALMGEDPSKKIRRDLLRSHIPLLRDSVGRLDKVIQALQSVGEISQSEGSSSAAQSEKIMDVVYGAANMLVSWDSFFGTRMQTALQADISDTLWQKSGINERQREYLLSVGPEIVGKLSGFFSNDPVSERTDLNAAKVAHITNLKAVEDQFAKVLFTEILDITCKLEGGFACDSRVLGQKFNPAGGFIEQNKIRNLNEGLAGFRSGKNALGRLLRWMYPTSEDSKALNQTRAKFCLQSLSFQSRDAFREVCKGSVLESDLADPDDSVGLHMSFDAQLEKIHSVLSGQGAGRMDRSRSLGVCSLRSYLRKNHVYFMHREYGAGE